MLDVLRGIWPPLLAVATLVVNVVASGHAILNKRNTRAAVAWVGVIWVSPIIGAVGYLLFGINRIRRRASSLREQKMEVTSPEAADPVPQEELHELLGPDHLHLGSLVHLGDRVLRKPLVAGNEVVPLEQGEAAYPAMIEAIDEAERSVSLLSYIFDRDDAGREFADALGRAVDRGVEVRVLVDDVGARYSFPAIDGLLEKRGVPVARFLPTLLPWVMPYMNLRNHRKILVCDGRVGFTGGMNIRAGHRIERHPETAVQDVHFRLEGPIVAQLQEIFVEDWAFTTDEVLEGKAWFPPLEACGPVVARGIADGPDEDFEKLRWMMLGALASARSSVRIVTPYFLPDDSLITAMSVAALRGAQVDVVLPAVNNLHLVQWASRALLWQILQAGCRVFETPAPFDHSKLMVVDRSWALVGSTNWDPRSLRLSFEFCVECWEPGLGAALDALVDAKLRDAHRVTWEEVEGRSLPVRLRDGVARLASPYL